MSVFHGLSAGNTVQPAKVGPPDEAPPVVLVALPAVLLSPFVIAAELEFDPMLLDAVLLPLALPLTADAISWPAAIALSASEQYPTQAEQS